MLLDLFLEAKQRGIEKEARIIGRHLVKKEHVKSDIGDRLLGVSGLTHASKYVREGMDDSALNAHGTSVDKDLEGDETAEALDTNESYHTAIRSAETEGIVVQDSENYIQIEDVFGDIKMITRDRNQDYKQEVMDVLEDMKERGSGLGPVDAKVLGDFSKAVSEYETYSENVGLDFPVILSKIENLNSLPQRIEEEKGQWDFSAWENLSIFRPKYYREPENRVKELTREYNNDRSFFTQERQDRVESLIEQGKAIELPEGNHPRIEAQREKLRNQQDKNKQLLEALKEGSTLRPEIKRPSTLEKAAKLAYRCTFIPHLGELLEGTGKALRTGEVSLYGRSMKEPKKPAMFDAMEAGLHTWGEWNNKMTSSKNWFAKAVGGISYGVSAPVNLVTGGAKAIPKMVEGVGMMLAHPKQAVVGIGTLVGRNAQTGKWGDGVAAKKSWTVMKDEILQWDKIKSRDFDQFFQGIGEAGVNIGTMVMTSGAVGGVKATSAAAKAAAAGKSGGTMAKVGAGMVGATKEVGKRNILSGRIGRRKRLNTEIKNSSHKLDDYKEQLAGMDKAKKNFSQAEYDRINSVAVLEHNKLVKLNKAYRKMGDPKSIGEKIASVPGALFELTPIPYVHRFFRNTLDANFSTWRTGLFSTYGFGHIKNYLSYKQRKMNMRKVNRIDRGGKRVVDITQHADSISANSLNHNVVLKVVDKDNNAIYVTRDRTPIHRFAGDDFFYFFDEMGDSISTWTIMNRWSQSKGYNYHTIGSALDDLKLNGTYFSNLARKLLDRDEVQVHVLLNRAGNKLLKKEKITDAVPVPSTTLKLPTRREKLKEASQASANNLKSIIGLDSEFSIATHIAKNYSNREVLSIVLPGVLVKNVMEMKNPNAEQVQQIIDASYDLWLKSAQKLGIEVKHEDKVITLKNPKKRWGGGERKYYTSQPDYKLGVLKTLHDWIPEIKRPVPPPLSHNGYNNGMRRARVDYSRPLPRRYPDNPRSQGNLIDDVLRED